MTDPLPVPTRGSAAPDPRTRTRRRLATAAAAGAIAAALAPGLAVLPAAAAPAAAGCPAARFGAAASADLIRLDLLDLRSLGAALPPVAGVRVASTAAATSGGPGGGSSADARYLQARLLGGTVPAGPLDAVVHQQAHPAVQPASAITATGVDLGVLAAGTGTLAAHATCSVSAGVSAQSSAALLNASVCRTAGTRCWRCRTTWPAVRRPDSSAGRGRCVRRPPRR